MLVLNFCYKHFCCIFCTLSLQQHHASCLLKNLNHQNSVTMQEVLCPLCSKVESGGVDIVVVEGSVMFMQETA